MSAARNEADTGPDNGTNEDSHLEYGQDQDVPEISFTTEAETVREDEEETSDAVLLNAKNQRYQPYQPTSPDIAEKPSSADGSLSIPDDTPSLQVSGSTFGPLQQRTLTLPEFHNVLCRQTLPTLSLCSKSYTITPTVRSEVSGSHLLISAEFSPSSITCLPSATFSSNVRE